MNDTEFLKNPSSWPINSDGERYCCLIKGWLKDRQYGFLLNGQPLLYGGVIFDGGDGTERRYDSIEDIVLDGWSVD